MLRHWLYKIPLAILTASTFTVAMTQPSFADTAVASAAPIITSSAQAITLAKRLFVIPTAYSQTFAFAQNGGFDAPGPVYLVTFSQARSSVAPGPIGQITVTLDAATGAVLAYNDSQGTSIWNDTGTVTESAAQSAAQAHAWLVKLSAHASQLSAAPSPLPPQSLFSDAERTYVYERVVHGIDVPFDQATVTVGAGGQLLSYASQWQDATFPAPTYPLWTSQAATTPFVKALGLHLAYVQPFTPGSAADTALVTYEQTPWTPSSLMFSSNQAELSESPWIDAHTGQVLNAYGQPLMPTTAPLTASSALVPGGQQRMPADFKQLISQSQATAYAKTAVSIPKDLAFSGASLNNQFVGFPAQEQPVWNLNWMNSQTGANLTVTVNAQNGMLANYSMFTNGFSSGPAGSTSVTGQKPTTVTIQQGQQIADAFAKTAYPTLAGALVPLPLTDGYRQYGSQPVEGYSFLLLVGGIPAESQSVSVGVNLLTGQVVNEFANLQSGVTYPSASHAVSLATAKQAYAQTSHLQLTYVLPALQTPVTTLKASPLTEQQSPPVQFSTHALLVYAPAMQSTQGIYNALTGKWVLAYSPLNGSNVPADIRGQYGEAAMKILLMQNLLPTKNGLVHPQATMTRGEFVQILIQANGEYSSGPGNEPTPYKDVSPSNPYYTAVQQAQSDGFLPAGPLFYPQAPISREAAAAILVNFLGWGTMAKQESLFQLPFTDASTIAPAYRGDAAIANAYHIIPSQNGAWNPTADLTIAQAAVAIVRAMQLHMGASSS